MMDVNGIKVLVDLLTLAHLHTSRAVVPLQVVFAYCLISVVRFRCVLSNEFVEINQWVIMADIP